MEGFILIDKPDGWTSHDVIGYLRKITKEKRIGHAGTLDPFATGLLIVAIGRQFTKRLEEFSGMQKEYVAMIHLGAISDTQDKTGVITRHETRITSQISSEPAFASLRTGKQRTIERLEIETVLQSFIGTQEQIPPMYSAKKIGGKKLYDLARAGKVVERKPNQVTIHKIELLSYKGQLLTVNCHVSTGTYIRTLAHDIGQTLGCGAYCEELRRTKIGKYSIENAVSPDILTPELITERLFNI